MPSAAEVSKRLKREQLVLAAKANWQNTLRRYANLLSVSVCLDDGAFKRLRSAVADDRAAAEGQRLAATTRAEQSGALPNLYNKDNKPAVVRFTFAVFQTWTCEQVIGSQVIRLESSTGYSKFWAAALPERHTRCVPQPCKLAKLPRQRLECSAAEHCNSAQYRSETVPERLVMDCLQCASGSGDTVAVKALSLRKAGGWKKVELFEREAKALQQLEHPCIPRYIEYFEADSPTDRDFLLVQARQSFTRLSPALNCS